MSDFNIKTIEIEDLKNRDISELSISLKADGTLLYWKDNNLISSRDIIRNDRFSHIVEILKKNNFPECYGEMYIESGNVFDISSKKNWNNALFMPIDLVDETKNYSERQNIITNKIKKINDKHIIPMMIFKDAKSGWDYVLKHKAEGLVLKNDNEWLKCKLLFEVKIEIVEHIVSKVKGTFILKNGGHLSGTSIGFVKQFYMMKQNKKTPMAEIEYCFLTKDGNFFQPRLRRIFDKEIKRGEE